MKNLFHKTFDVIKSIFLTGLLTLLPITLTFIIFKVFFNFTIAWLDPIHNLLPKNLQFIPYSEVIFVVLVIFIVGLLLKFLVINPIIHFFEEMIVFKIPLIRPVYSGIKQLVHALTTQDQFSFNKVVLVEFPSKGLYCLGFLTGEFPKEISPDQQEPYFSVFIPTTPNPTTGFFFTISKDKFIEVDLNRQEAMAIIISGGIIRPDRFVKKTA